MVHPCYLVSECSGWILPEGRFVPVEEWWHVSGLYDLKDQNYPLFQSDIAQKIFQNGNEESIRNFAAQVGLVKIGRGQLDGEKFNEQQLVTLKLLIQFLDPEFEFEILSPSVGLIKKMSVDRILKVKNTNVIFAKT